MHVVWSLHVLSNNYDLLSLDLSVGESVNVRRNLDFLGVLLRICKDLTEVKSFPLTTM
jgi:hypothetical protein